MDSDFAVEAGQAKLKVTIRAEVNMFMKAMVAKPLQDGVDKLAEMLSMILIKIKTNMAQKLWEKKCPGK